jgi:hypothetical protein
MQGAALKQAPEVLTIQVLMATYSKLIAGTL